MEELTILATAHHRNGVAAAPFDVVLFRDNVVGDTKIMVRFPRDRDCVAVLSVDLLAEGDIEFASNSWRGDVFDWKVDRALANFG